MVPLSQVTSIVEEHVARALAKRDEEAAELAKTKALEVSALATQAVAPPANSNFPFGNQDDDEEFDLSKLLPGSTEFPADKVTIVIQTYFSKPSGKELEDEDERRVQFIDPQDFAANTKPDKETGISTYDLMGLRFTVINKPVGK
ncbi:hypothetical protein [Spirosoma foliorum]|uniref:Uncharacterized protein n=1 Tax=Spirosoma foliorum TaxID=2710596 RepID=A0A7G5H5I7_9BACT|nr:hypothetical protein [Spirosoma foliorum]QMW06379.1 hypothetical protein H3H32_16550 [Spirosoma foliorum]